MNRMNSVENLQLTRPKASRWQLPKFVGILILLWSCSRESARAGFISSSVEIDLSQARISDDGSGGQLILGVGTTLVPVNSFTPHVGDILITTITFANADRLRINNGVNAVSGLLSGPDYFESLTFYFGGSGWHRSHTTAVSFMDLEGHLSNPNPGESVSGILGQGLLNVTDSWISFRGVTLTTTIKELPNSGVQSYQDFGMWGGRAGGFEIIPGTAVPEPASIVMWAIGAIGIVNIRRKRKQQTAAA